jgi:Holliday junction resolvase RusA-like endonuclease
MFSITLPGRPITKKNSQQIFINRSTGKPFITQSEQYKQYENECLWRLKGQAVGIRENVHLVCQYWLPNKRGWPDLVGLIQSTQDILEKAGVLLDDKQVVSLDGSEIAGIDKDNPRVEVFIYERP